jgi:hypothetical protein
LVLSNSAQTAAKFLDEIKEETSEITENDIGEKSKLKVFQLKGNRNIFRRIIKSKAGCMKGYFVSSEYGFDAT